MSNFGAISVEHNGGPGALLARGMALDTALGYSLPIQFTDPMTAKSTNLHGAGLRIGKAGKESVEPMVVVHNAGQTTTLLRGRVPYTTTDGTNGEIILPQIELSPRETEVIKIAPYVRARGVANDGSVAGLEFEYTGELGSVITSAFSVSQSATRSFGFPCGILPPNAARPVVIPGSLKATHRRFFTSRTLQVRCKATECI